MFARLTHFLARSLDAGSLELRRKAIHSRLKGYKSEALASVS